MAYLPIEDYGIIGNMRTCALVGINGSVDWFCAPRFDSPSVFGAILDDQKGGYFQIAPPLSPAPVHKQVYWPESNVLITRFLSASGVAEVVDFMPVSTAQQPPPAYRANPSGQLRARGDAFHPGVLPGL